MDSLESKSLALLLACDGVGHVTARHILTAVRLAALSWEEFWVASEATLEKVGLQERTINSVKKIVKEYTIDAYSEHLLSKGIRVVTECQAEYPQLLREIEQPPIVLFAKGKTMVWGVGSVPIAVVGARHMTAYGKMATEKITYELVTLGASIISGCMYGVDTCAHTTALSEGGATVGILGYGFDFVYPRSHAGILADFLNRGICLMTPFALNVRPNKGNFPARNAIVAGMSAAVVVTEASEKSGTHITAACAAEYGRPVCAVPGPINNPYCRGTKWLINQGAVLIGSGDEVYESLGIAAQWGGTEN